MKPEFFASAGRFRAWLERNHDRADELWVGFHRMASDKPSMTWPESVDEALCFGWIDGIRRKIDDTSYVIRFTPRRQGSIWSARNIERVNVLTEAGRMKRAGIAAFEDARAKKRRYSFEQEEVALTDDMVRAFRKDRKAWSFFQSQPDGYRRTATWWVISAKREQTRERRLSTLIDDSRAGRRIAQLRRDP